jgi:hypothetical protein
MDLSPLEAERRAEATESLIAEMRAGTQTHAWWNRSFEELDGRTPTEALADGDETPVLDLIAYWYRRSEEAAERARSDPALMEMLREKSASLRRSA